MSDCAVLVIDRLLAVVNDACAREYRPLWAEADNLGAHRGSSGGIRIFLPSIRRWPSARRTGTCAPIPLLARR
jgi:hypothetical protein